MQNGTDLKLEKKNGASGFCVKKVIFHRPNHKKLLGEVVLCKILWFEGQCNNFAIYCGLMAAGSPLPSPPQPPPATSLIDSDPAVSFSQPPSLSQLNLLGLPLSWLGLWSRYRHCQHPRTPTTTHGATSSTLTSA